MPLNLGNIRIAGKPPSFRYLDRYRDFEPQLAVFKQPKTYAAVTSLSAQERAYVVNFNLKRATDNNTVLLHTDPDVMEFTEMIMRSEKGWGHAELRDILENHIKGKRVLIVPAYQNLAFLFALLGAKQICAVDLDPVTIAWLKAIRNNFYHDNLGEAYMNLSAFPDYDAEVSAVHRIKGLIRRNGLVGALNEQTFFQAALANIVLADPVPQPLANVAFYQASLGPKQGAERVTTALSGLEGFDLIFVPWILGIKNGITDPVAIQEAYEDIYALAKPGAKVMITPFSFDSSGSGKHFESSAGIVNKLKALLPQSKFHIVNENILYNKAWYLAILEVAK